MCPKWRYSRIKHAIHDNMEELLGKSCNVENLIKFLKEMGLFDDTLEYRGQGECEGLTMSVIKEVMSYSLK